MTAPAEPLTLPPGVEVGGRVLTYRAHRACPCVDCTEAFRAFRERRLIMPDREASPW